MAAAMTLEAETSDALAVQRTLPDDALRIAASASRRTARLETKRGCSCDLNRALPAIKNGGETLSLPTSRPDQARAMACPARARSPWRPTPHYQAAGDRRRRDADAWEGPMAGLVGDIAWAEVNPGAAACLLYSALQSRKAVPPRERLPATRRSEVRIPSAPPRIKYLILRTTSTL